MVPKPVVVRQRLGFEDVEGGGRDMSVVQCFQQVGFDQVITTGQIDNEGATRQLIENLRVKDAVCLVGERQEANQDAGVGEEWSKAVGAVKTCDTGNALGSARPAGDVEPQLFKAGRDRLTDDTEAEQADTAFLGQNLRVAAKDAIALLRLIHMQVAMEPQGVHQCELDHAACKMVVDDASNRHIRRTSWIFEYVIDPSAKRENGAQIWQACQEAIRRFPDKCELDIKRVADVRPDTDLKIGQAGVELL